MVDIEWVKVAIVEYGLRSEQEDRAFGKGWSEAAATRDALRELLAYREGYDPKERLPEPGRKVLVDSGDFGMTEASLREWHESGEVIWQGTGWSAPLEYVVRWYPLPGGHDGDK